MLSFEGDTGPYPQYAQVRLSFVECKNTELLPLPASSQLKVELLVELPAREIAFLLSSYPEPRGENDTGVARAERDKLHLGQVRLEDSKPCYQYCLYSDRGGSSNDYLWVNTKAFVFVQIKELPETATT